MSVPAAPSRLDFPAFTRRLVNALATEMRASLGEEQARDVVRLAGLGMGEDIEREIAPPELAPARAKWTPADLGEVLVELKAAIGGDFSVESATREAVVLVNRRCPFGAEVRGRPALCMMTSSVFGGIAARRFGRARVDIEEAIARGDAGCRVVVHLAEPRAPGGDWSESYVGDDPSR